MENHPIPQDITGFQFKLIGDMSIKQFAYLAAGAILAWLSFVLPIFIFIKIPLILTFAGLGVGAAFVPIEGRPFDVMIGNYFKALFSPTQYIYQKTGGHMWFPEPQVQNKKAAPNQTPSNTLDSAKKLKDFLNSLPQRPKNKLDEKEMNFLNSLSGISGSLGKIPGNAFDKLQEAKKTLPINPPPPPKPEIPQESNKLKTEDNLDKTAEVLKKELAQAKIDEKANQGNAQEGISKKKVEDLEKILSDVQAQKQALENQILELTKKIGSQNQKVYTPSTAQVQDTTQKVRMIPKQMEKTAGFPFVPDVPNLIMGIIKDSRGNPLPNILVEVKDTSDNPVRAFKTNVLGQFASATPLGNGTYNISFEDPKNEHKFDTVQITTEGVAIMPIEVISIDSREELRRSLFGNNN